MKRARIVLAEDHEAVSRQLRLLVEQQHEVVANVTDGYGMIGAFFMLKPDVIVADVAMQPMDGITAAEWILERDPGARIVVVTIHREPELLERAMEIGALGYVSKFTADEQLVLAIDAALRGEKYIDASLQH